MTKQDHSLPVGGIPLRPLATSSHLPHSFRVEALELSDDDADAAENEGPTEKEMVEDVEDSPGAEWRKYLQPILREVKLLLNVPLELRNSFTVPVQGDSSLGFHITGVVYFTDGIPPDIEETLDGRALRYKAYVSPDGILADQVELLYLTEDRYEMDTPPVYRHNPNQYSI